MLHTAPEGPNLLPQALARHTRLRVKHAEEGDVLRPGVVYVAPPDRHVLINPDETLSLSQGPKVHHTRPSAEPLFESAAAVLRDRLVAVVLTGEDGDGSGAVRAVKRAGGMVIAQDKATSAVFGMPKAAIQTGAVDVVLPLDGIAPALTALVLNWGGGAK